MFKSRSLRRFAAVLLCFSLLAVPLTVHAGAEPIHILLIGKDQRPGISGSRSDTILLCSFQKDSGEVLLTSFLRDLYVPIPGHGKNRINAAYSFGGSKLLQKTLESNFGISIHGTMEVDFTQFSGIIDALGGVVLELREDEARHINRDCPGKTLHAGSQQLDGHQALCYARIRDLDADGDFSRTRRQQTLLRSLFSRWRSAPPSAILDAVNTLLPLISTDLSPVQLLRWIVDLAPMLSRVRVESLQIPIAGTYRNENVDGMDVLVPNLEQNREIFFSRLKAQP